jgi:hypothetical protein
MTASAINAAQKVRSSIDKNSSRGHIATSAVFAMRFAVGE